MKLFTNDPQDLRELKKFALIMTVVFGGIFGLALPLLLGRPLPSWPHRIWPPLLLAALFLPSALSLVYIPWMKLGHVLGQLNTKLILTIIYFVLFTPLAVLRRLMKKDSLARLFDTHLTSYRVYLSREAKNSSMERPF